MGSKNLPPIFFMATETVVDLRNEDMRCNNPALLHMLDGMVEYIVRE